MPAMLDGAKKRDFRPRRLEANKRYNKKEYLWSMRDRGSDASCSAADTIEDRRTHYPGGGLD